MRHEDKSELLSERDPEAFLRSADIRPDPVRKRASLDSLHRAYAAWARYRIPSVWELLRIQVSYISPGTWIFQAALMTLLALFLWRMDIGRSNFREAVKWCSVGAALAGTMGMAELGRHFTRNMAELEQSCFLNLRQIMTVKLLILSAADMLALVCLGGDIARRAELGLLPVCVYVLTPFVMANLCCLLFFGAVRNRYGRYRQLALAVLLGVAAALPSAYPMAYKINCLWVWAAALTAAVLLLILEMRRLYGRLAKGEELCWN